MEKKSQKWGLRVFAVLFMALCLLPFVGMAWARTDVSAQSGGLAPEPVLFEEDGSFNIDYLQELGAYFEDHFAYRNEAIDINAHIRVTLFQTSPTDQVIVGSDNWLYYGGTLSDYLAEDPLSEREAENIAHNLTLMQGYTQAKGAEFVFTIAPNKNSLYPQHMPYYWVRAENPSMDLLGSKLEEAGIDYVNMFDLFGEEDEELYFLHDTHWNNEGALLATDALLKAGGREETNRPSDEQEEEFTGDIEKMLYPVTAAPEEALAFSVGYWSYIEGSSVEDASIETSSSGEGTLLMYRDSFANNVIPLMSPSFKTSYYTKLIPYDFTRIDALKPSCVIIERAERHIDLLAEDPPIMPVPKAKVEPDSTMETATSIDFREDGDFIIIEGWVDESAIGLGDQIFLQIESPKQEKTSFVPFYLSRKASEGASGGSGASEFGSAQADSEVLPSLLASDYGFRGYFPKSLFSESEYTVTVLISNADSSKVVAVANRMLQQ